MKRTAKIVVEYSAKCPKCGAWSEDLEGEEDLKCHKCGYHFRAKM